MACVQMSVKNCFIRGSVVRYIQVSCMRLPAAVPHTTHATPTLFPAQRVGELASMSALRKLTEPAMVITSALRSTPVCRVQLPPGAVDVDILHDATRRENREAGNK